MKHLVLKLLAFVSLSLAISSCESHELTEPGRLVPFTVDEDLSLPSISVNGTKLHSEAFGDLDDPMIIAIHGGPGADYRSLLYFKQFVNDGFYVVFYDQRGSGLSRRHDKSIYTDQIMIDDLDAVINHYRQPGQKLILIGHSWGAMLAAGYVNQNPNNVDGLVLMEPGGLTWEVTETYLDRTLDIDPFSENTNDVLYLDQFITSSHHDVLDYKFALAAVADYADGNILGNAGPYPYWRNGAECRSGMFEYVMDNPFDFTTNLNQFQPEVLFMYSELNEAYGKLHADLVSAPFTHIELVEIDGTGHEIPYFGWDNLYPVALSYLNSIK